MARIGLSDVNSLNDPFLGYQFELSIPSVPSGDSSTELTTRCRSTSIPGMQLEPVEVTLHGVTLEYAGRPTLNHDLQCTFIESNTMYVRTTLLNWLDYTNSLTDTTGNEKSSYATTAYLLLYDQTMTCFQTLTLHNFWIKTVDDAGLDGSQSSALELNATFSFDWVTST